MAASKAQRAASAKYDASHTIQIKLKLNTKTDADILEKLEAVDSKQGYIKDLIRRDIEKNEKGSQMHRRDMIV